MAENARMRILQLIDEGQITAEEGLRRLAALSAEVLPAPAAPPPDLERWRRWWLLPAGVGAAITALGGSLMYWAYAAGGFGFWFACAALPFALGALVLALAAGSRSSRWIHIRIRTGERAGPQNIALSFPLPIRLTAWFLRAFGRRIARLRETGVDELILAVAENTSGREPFFVEVDEGERGERVMVYIG